MARYLSRVTCPRQLKCMKKIIYPLLLMLPSLTLFAGEPIVVDASASPIKSGVYRFDVTLRHSDEGWDHYADAWDVTAPNGEILGHRTLFHPHVDEQPFTRSLSGVAVPEGIDHVEIRAHDSVHGYSSQPYRVNLE